jgi:hypothetical protein
MYGCAIIMYYLWYKSHLVVYEQNFKFFKRFLLIMFSVFKLTLITRIE